ncbi:MAG TPA: alpha/beta hydrolase [Crocinitomix sp.]|nr:alpha/beta hydrolase [Crocinitomix sp.]
MTSEINLLKNDIHKTYVGSNNRLSVYDLKIPQNPKALVIFLHGYKGYKDWGAWNVVEKQFINNNYGFLKFNFSHNGGTVKNPIDFTDLDAFGNNDYTKELYDLNRIITLARNELKLLNLSIPFYLIGHSRGGGIAILQTAKDKSIKKLVTWAAISDIESRFPTGDELEDWKISGVRYVHNARTNQNMPHYYSFYENYIENKDQLNIEYACKNLKVPFLPIHGDMDLAVSISEGIQISKWANVRLEIIKGAEHTFQTKQPWTQNALPYDMKTVVEKTITFFNQGDDNDT